MRIVIALAVIITSALADEASDAVREKAYEEAANHLENHGAVVDPATFPPAAGLGEALNKDGLRWGTAIQIDPHDRVTDDDLAVFMDLNPIFHLSIDHPTITEKGFKKLKELEDLRWASLRYDSTYGFNIPGGDVSQIVSSESADRTIVCLINNRHLESISFTGPLSGETVGQFSDHVSLRALSLQGARLTDEGMQQIGTLTQLETLSLIGCNVTDSELKHLVGLRNLETLSLGENPITGRGLDALAELPKLKRLHLTRCFLLDERTAVLADLKALEFLELSDNQIGDRALEHLAASAPRPLTDLRLLGTDVTDDGMRNLRSLSNLEHVWMSGTRVTGTGLVHLRDLPKLRMITLAYAGLTDENAEGLFQLKQVESLVLDGNDISDAAVHVLAQLEQLGYVSIAHTAITEKGWDKLHDALPNCRIDHGDAGSQMDRVILLDGQVLPPPLSPYDSSFGTGTNKDP